MNVRKPIITSLISLATLAPCKAQKTVQFVSETGITGVVNKDASFYTGMNLQFFTEKNYSDIFAGTSVSPDKSISFLGLAINNYAWTKNISTWARETFVASRNTSKSTLEIAPVKANVSAGKFNFAFSPAYALHNDFKTGSTTQGINTIFQASYSISPKDMISAEAKYTSEPVANLFKTRFGKFKDNISYFICYLRNL